MALLTALSLPEAARLAAEHGVDVGRVNPLEAGSVNSNFLIEARDGSRFFARVYEEQGVQGALAEHRLLRELAAAGVKVVVPLRSNAGSPPVIAGKPFAVYPWVDGDIVCQARVTRDHCERVGEALARVHLASDAVSVLPEGRFDVAGLMRRLERIEAESAEFAPEARELRARLEYHAARRDPDLPSGVTHGDLFRDNVLWVPASERPTIAALIDFESASRGSFAFDLMVTLMAWCYADAFVPELLEALLRAYHAARPLEAEERAALVTEGAVAALRFATTRITDFSMRAKPGERPKRDFRRFIARLEALEGGALDETVGALPH